MSGIQTATVRKDGVIVGSLVRADGRVRFEYAAGYDGAPIARTIPVGHAVDAPAGQVPAFFAHLLPRGPRRDALARRVGTDDELDLLVAQGACTIGDVTVLAAGERPRATPPADRIALPGSTTKHPLGVDGFVKLAPAHAPHAAEVEAYVMSVARLLRVPAARTELVRDGEGIAGLVVERFDHGPTENVAQLLGIRPERAHNITTERAMAAVADVCAAPVVALRDVLTRVVFAWLVGDADCDATNISVLRQAGEWRVAPVYDATCSLAWGAGSLAMPVRGRRDHITRERLVGLGVAVGLPERAATRVVDDVMEATIDVVDDIRGGVLPLSERASERIAAELERRRVLLSGARWR